MGFRFSILLFRTDRVRGWLVLNGYVFEVIGRGLIFLVLESIEEVYLV